MSNAEAVPSVTACEAGLLCQSRDPRHFLFFSHPLRFPDQPIRELESQYSTTKLTAASAAVTGSDTGSGVDGVKTSESSADVLSPYTVIARKKLIAMAQPPEPATAETVKEEPDSKTESEFESTAEDDHELKPPPQPRPPPKQPAASFEAVAHTVEPAMDRIYEFVTDPFTVWKARIQILSHLQFLNSFVRPNASGWSARVQSAASIDPDSVNELLSDFSIARVLEHFASDPTRMSSRHLTRVINAGSVYAPVELMARGAPVAAIDTLKLVGDLPSEKRVKLSLMTPGSNGDTKYFESDVDLTRLGHTIRHAVYVLSTDVNDFRNRLIAILQHVRISGSVDQWIIPSHHHHHHHHPLSVLSSPPVLKISLVGVIMLCCDMI